MKAQIFRTERDQKITSIEVEVGKLEVIYLPVNFYGFPRGIGAMLFPNDGYWRGDETRRGVRFLLGPWSILVAWRRG